MSIGPIGSPSPGALPPQLPPVEEKHHGGGHGHRVGGDKKGAAGAETVKGKEGHHSSHQVGAWGKTEEAEKTDETEEVSNLFFVESEEEKNPEEEDQEQNQDEEKPSLKLSKKTSANRRHRNIMDFIRSHMKNY